MWAKTLTRRTLRGADAVWFTSVGDLARLALPDVTGEVVPNGIEVARWATISRVPEPGRWLVPGRLDAHKGHLALIRAVGGLPRARRPVLHVVGPESVAGLGRRIQAEAARWGVVVHLKGEVEASTYREELARCEIAVFPSSYEGFGVGLVEAMAAGVPPLINDLPVFREKVGRTEGWWVDVSDPAPNWMPTPGASELARRSVACRRSAARYDWGRVFETYMRGYARLLEDL